MNSFDRILPWAVAALAAIYLIICAIPSSQPAGTFNLDDFAALPVKYNGRVQPFDSVARNSLMIISSRQTFAEETGPKDNPIKTTQPAVRWLLDLISYRGDNHKVFRIENEQVLTLLGLEPRPGSYRYSYAEIFPRLKQLQESYEALPSKKTHELFATKVSELAQQVNLYKELRSSAVVLMCPPSEPGERWLSLRKVVENHQFASEKIFASGMPALYQSFHEGNVSRFNETLAAYQKWFKEKLPKEMDAAEQETFFNRFAPFNQAAILYVLVFVLACLSWIVRPQAFFQAAFVLGILTLLLHSWALLERMYLSGRPAPVVNLYSSAVFIGWGCSLLGLCLDFVFRNGIGCAVGAVTGAATLIIAHFLSISGDTLGVLMPVLDTNFWLIIHVTSIAFGFTATFIAGFLGIAYVLTMLFVAQPARETVQDLGRMIYGVVCFATLFSFFGTVSGGIWGDQSWGRFWGWDPKENGALLVVLMNALILHARWGGMVKLRGMAVLTILGNIVTAWAWFGVNMLGLGLHSYGRMDGGLIWLELFVLSHLLLAILGMIDPAIVRSFASAVGCFFKRATMKLVSYLTGSGGDTPDVAAKEV